jgi:hypothetical protein
VSKRNRVRGTLELPAEGDLDLSLRMISELNRTIAAADTKAGLLLTAIGFALTGLVAAVRGGGFAAGGWPLDLMVVLVVVPLVVCVGYLTATVRPVLSAGGAPSWFSFPMFPALPGSRPPERPGAAVLAEQAWRQVATLAMIARRKHRAFALALHWGTGGLVTFLGCLAAAFVLTPAP